MVNAELQRAGIGGVRAADDDHFFGTIIEKFRHF